MNDEAGRALQTDRLIDVTTIGRSSGLPRRIETWFHRVDDGFYLTGSPGRRDWYANLLKTPEFTFHLKERVTADLDAWAQPITDVEEKRRVLSQILRNLGQPQDLEAWMAGSPLVQVAFDRPPDDVRSRAKERGAANHAPGHAESLPANSSS